MLETHPSRTKQRPSLVSAVSADHCAPRCTSTCQVTSATDGASTMAGDIASRPCDNSPSLVEHLYVFRTYINPLVYVVIITFGLVWNGVLLVMFARHKEIRTPANMMILNLTVSDILNLVITAPLLCIYHFPHDAPEDTAWCRAHIFASHFLTTLSALSLLALSLQRFSVTQVSTPLTVGITYVLAVWTLSAIASLPLVLVSGVHAFLCGCGTDLTQTRILVIVYFLIYFVALPSCMVALSVLTARRLRSSTREIPGEQCRRAQVQVRERSATVVTVLAALFLGSHAPYWLWALATNWAQPDWQSALVVVSEYVTKYCLFLDCCFNPVALYVASGTFRRLFRRYLCCAGRGDQVV